MEYYAAITRNEILTYVVTWRNLKNIKLSKRNQIKMSTFYIHLELYDSIYMKHSEQANPQQQKADWWLSVAGECRVTA